MHNIPEFMADCRSTDRHQKDGAFLSIADRELLFHLLDKQDKESIPPAVGREHRLRRQRPTPPNWRINSHHGNPSSSEYVASMLIGVAPFLELTEQKTHASLPSPKN
jgi:hypothetical protein